MATQTTVALQAMSTQTCLIEHCQASTQTAVSSAEAACQCCSEDEQASAAQQRLEETHEEVMGLQSKVQSLQSIVDVQEQQLLAAAGQSRDQASRQNSFCPS